MADNLTRQVPLVPRVRRVAHRLAGSCHPLERDPAVVRTWADAGARVLAQAGDPRTVVLTGAIPGVELPDQYDLAIWADATFHALRRPTLATTVWLPRPSGRATPSMPCLRTGARRLFRLGVGG